MPAVLLGIEFLILAVIRDSVGLFFAGVFQIGMGIGFLTVKRGE